MPSWFGAELAALIPGAAHCALDGVLTARNNAPREAAGRSGRGSAKMCHSWSLVGCDEGRGMYGVELYAAVRLAVVDEGFELLRGGPSVRHRPPDGEEDAELFGAAGVSADEAGQAAEAGRVHRHRRRDPGGGHGSGRAAQAASHGASDLRAATGRARVHRRYTHREGLCAFPAAIDARGLRSTASPAGPCPGRLRRGGGGGRGQAGEGRLLPDPAPFQPGSSRRIPGRRRRPSWTAMSAPSPSSAGFRARSSHDNTTLRWHGSWATARVGARRRSRICNRTTCSATASAGPARATTGQGRGPGEDGRRRFMVPIPRCTTCRS